MTYYTNEGKTYCVVGTADGTVTSASGVVIASFSANEQSYFTAPAGGFVTISDETAIVTPVFDLAPSALVGKSSGGDSPSGDYGDFVGYVEYDDETGAIVDLSIPKYLAGNLTFKNAVFPENYEWKIDMPYLTNGEDMFYNCTNLRSFSSDLPKLSNGMYMFQSCTNLISFEGDLSALTNGSSMFRSCSNLTSFRGDLSALTDGSSMFLSCSNLTSFRGDLSNLIDGEDMFGSCLNLSSFEGDLSNLIDGEDMFGSCLNLSSFEGDLSALTNGRNMFYGCTNLTEWNTPLSALTDGYYMFRSCSNLRSFSADLSSLNDGNGMFQGCKLDAASVECILTTIPTYTDGSTHTLTLWASSEAAAKFEEITGVTFPSNIFFPQ